MKKIIYAIVLLIFARSAGAENLPVLRWAADAESNAPYIFQDPKDPSRLIGFEVDIVNALARELKIKPVFVQNQWDGLIPGLARDDYDIAINGLEITPDRADEVEFSLPYYLTHEQLVTLAGETAITDLRSLRGLKAGALKFSLAERILREYGGIETLTYEGEVNAFLDMKNARIRAALVDAPIAIYYASWNPDYKLVGEPIGRVTYGIALRKGNIELRDRINVALRKIRESGELRLILERWKLWNNKMAEALDDYSGKTIEPVNYNKYIASQSKPKTSRALVERYIAFLPLLGKAALVTLGITLISMLLAVVAGLLIAILRLYAPAPISFLSAAYIEIIRGTPLLIQLLFIFYALPTIGIKLPPFIAAVLGLGLNYAAYEAENYRAGIGGVPRGQTEAALSLGMSRLQTVRHIVLPQAFRLVIPPITNDFISLLKDSSLVSVITLVELTKQYGQLASTYYDYIGTGLLVAAIYLLLGLPFVKLSKLTERYFSVENRK